MCVHTLALRLTGLSSILPPSANLTTRRTEPPLPPTVKTLKSKLGGVAGAPPSMPTKRARAAAEKSFADFPLTNSEIDC